MTWRSQAACRGSDTALWFAEDQGEVKAAVAVCKGCPVREECLTWAIETGEAFGVLGGMTFRQRRGERRRRRAVDRQGRANAAQCGTASGYSRHRRLGQEACDPCKAANSAYKTALFRRAG